MMRLVKMHGTRNDFVVADARKEPIADAAGLARWACDRRSGIGADGLIVLEPSSIAQLRMRILNADASEAKMCGNGIRCAARWLHELGEGDHIEFETDAGLVETEIVARKPEYLIRVSMGEPKLSAVEVLGRREAFVDVGNPHVVLYREDLDSVDLTAVAAQVQSDCGLVTGANVHVAARTGKNSLRVRHWERGVGLTPACGTGAVACAAVAITRGEVVSPVEVVVPGGHLTIEWNGSGTAHLTGPAVRVFEIEVDLGAASLR